jgi:aspartyl/glutamyl-tRNA(Asn/Gln) amidotransferase C subunit
MTAMALDPFLSPAGVAKVARLARIEIPAGELAHWGEQVEKIVDHVNRLREIPDAELPEIADAPETTLRVDMPVAGSGSGELNRNAGEMSHGHVPVPRVVDSAR